MRRIAIALVLLGVVGATVGCPTKQIRDEEQESNIQVAIENYQRQKAYMEGTTEGAPQQPSIPPKALRDSLWDLLKAMLGLEQSKKESWQEQARSAGWKPE